jgi:hypothetical protein
MTGKPSEGGGGKGALWAFAVTAFVGSFLCASFLSFLFFAVVGNDGAKGSALRIASLDPSYVGYFYRSIL